MMGSECTSDISKKYIILIIIMKIDIEKMTTDFLQAWLEMLKRA